MSLPDKYQDHIELGDKKKTVFRTEVMIEAQNFMNKENREGRPWCYRCFKMDFVERQEKAAPAQGLGPDSRKGDEKQAVITYSMAKAPKSEFIKLRDQTITKKKIIDGQAQYMQYYYKEFQCVKCGAQYCIENPERRPKAVSETPEATV